MKISHHGLAVAQYLKFIFLPTPPFLIIFLPQLKFIVMRGARRMRKICSLFFAILYTYVKVNWGKNMHTFKQLGEKNAFSPFFYPLSIKFFPQPVIWPYLSMSTLCQWSIVHFDVMSREKWSMLKLCLGGYVHVDVMSRVCQGRGF